MKKPIKIAFLIMLIALFVTGYMPPSWLSIEVGDSQSDVEAILETNYGPIDHDMKGIAYERNTFFGKWVLWVHYKNSILTTITCEINLGWPPYNRREIIFSNSLNNLN